MPLAIRPMRPQDSADVLRTPTAQTFHAARGFTRRDSKGARFLMALSPPGSP